MRSAVTHIIDRVDTITLTIANLGTTAHEHFQKPGYLKGIAYTLNNNTNNVTTVISIVDDQGFTLYSSSALSENTSGYLKPDIALYNSSHALTITSADPGASTNIATLTLLIER